MVVVSVETVLTWAGFIVSMIFYVSLPQFLQRDFQRDVDFDLFLSQHTHAIAPHFIPFMIDMAQSAQDERHVDLLLRADMLWRASSARVYLAQGPT